MLLRRTGTILSEDRPTWAFAFRREGQQLDRSGMIRSSGPHAGAGGCGRHSLPPVACAGNFPAAAEHEGSSAILRGGIRLALCQGYAPFELAISAGSVNLISLKVHFLAAAGADHQTSTHWGYRSRAAGAAALRQRWPAAKLSWLVTPACAELVEKHPLLDEVILFQRTPFGAGWYNPAAAVGPVSFCPAMPAESEFDLVIDLQGLVSAAPGSPASGTRRVGFSNAREFAPLFYTEPGGLLLGAGHAAEDI